MVSKKEQIMLAIDTMDDENLHSLEVFAKYLSSTSKDITERRNAINRIFGDFKDIPVSVLVQIHDNWILFKMGFLSTDRIFINLDQSILMKNPNDILLHFGEINIYAVMSLEQYTKFKEYSKQSTIYQIILLSESQKVILLCDKSPEFVEELIVATKRNTNYELEVRAAENQLEIKNKIAANYTESKNIYDDLTKTLYRKYRDISKILKLVKPEQHIGSSHRILKLPLPAYSGSGTSELGTIVINMHITGDNNGTINIFSGNKTGTKKNKTAIAKDKTAEWIKDNPPLVAIGRKEYHEKYVNYSSGSFTTLNAIHFGRVLNKTLGSDNITSPSVSGTLCYLYTPPN